MTKKPELEWKFETVSCAISLVLLLFFLFAGPWPAAVFFAALALLMWSAR